jgi:GTP-binding protein
MSDAEDTPDFAEIGRKLFAQACDFIWAAEKIDGLPPMGPLEIAFAGRSNVGKSSLLNALTGRKALARTSHTPGRTQQLNFFNLGPDPDAAVLRLVDMPGYGYAAVSKEKIANWTRLMKEFLRGRATLARVFVLIDGRHGLKDVDHDMLKQLDQAALSYQIVLTKRDEVKLSLVEKTIADAQAALRKHPAAHPEVIFLSSHKGDGVSELRETIAKLMFERDRQVFERA